jgi:hypothetical protein
VVHDYLGLTSYQCEGGYDVGSPLTQGWSLSTHLLAVHVGVKGYLCVDHRLWSCLGAQCIVEQEDDALLRLCHKCCRIAFESDRVVHGRISDFLREVY